MSGILWSKIQRFLIRCITSPRRSRNSKVSTPRKSINSKNSTEIRHERVVRRGKTATASNWVNAGRSGERWNCFTTILFLWVFGMGFRDLFYFRNLQDGRGHALVASYAVSDPSLSAPLPVHYSGNSAVPRPLRLHTHFRSRCHWYQVSSEKT